ncbi:YfhO family protein [Maioricimonas sp. JC845]|uniref:YfhO family protein n=1 Tax=Maioricimonas sp. JC845 TaxID=3232138 RepID=UPI00345831FB
MQPDSPRPRVPEWLLAIGIGLGLTWIFWSQLWLGGGLIGGDLYPYYFPQKTFYADQLGEGHVPLWNPLVGHGYPALAESQTGVFYPPHLLLYRLLDVNAAYNAVQLLHYVIAFVGCWMLARQQGLRMPGAALAALVYVYGWFPSRICLEWAVLTGAWLPWLIWLAERWLRSGGIGNGVALSLLLGVALLAGHFHLVFIASLLLVCYALLRFVLARSQEAGDRPGWRKYVLLGTFIALGYGVGAVQLVPTWELTRDSQRADSVPSEEYDPAYGHIPPAALSQVVAPWLWYVPNLFPGYAIQQSTFLTYPAATNDVEAHLYFGLLPALIVLFGLVAPLWGGRRLPPQLVGWALFGLLAAIYATGWLLPITRYLPGFGFFRGPGRYGIVTTLAAGLIAGWVVDGAWRRGVGLDWRKLGVIVLFVVTTADLWLVSRLATYATIVPEPPIDFRRQSDLARVLSHEPGHPRVYAPAPNMLTLTGTAAVPVYLGLGPSAYFGGPLTFSAEDREAGPLAELDRLRRMGVTHLLMLEPVDASQPGLEPIWIGFDALLSRALGRYDEPFYLYRIENAPGRVSLQSDGPAGQTEIVGYEPSQVVIEASSEEGGTLVLRDLMAPGWHVSVDGESAEAVLVDEVFRGVELPAGTHRVEWRYEPASFRYGLLLTELSVLLLIAGLIARKRLAAWGQPPVG